ncbi:MAG: hypothetical protein HY645_14885 [Acidobacteria bacterium]|nr:hypothetical protein [Acidobacteriota bacterium]
MTRVPYKGFIIDAKPFHLQGDRWSVNLDIERHTGADVRCRNFNALNTYATEAGAIQHCINLGMQIIDGQVENCSVDDL